MTRYSISLTNCHLRSVAAENFGEAKWRARSALFHVCPLRWAHPSIDPDRFASKAITRGLAVPHSSMANFPSFVRITTSECPGSVLRRVAALTHHFVMPHALRIMEWRLRPAGSWKDVAIAKSKRRIAPGGQAGRRRTSEHAAARAASSCAPPERARGLQARERSAAKRFEEGIMTVKACRANERLK